MCLDVLISSYNFYINLLIDKSIIMDPFFFKFKFETSIIHIIITLDYGILPCNYSSVN
jgi:hypothetical protein